MKIVCTNKTKQVWELENGKWEGKMNEGRGRGGRWGQLRWTFLSFLFPPLLSFPFLFSLYLFFFLIFSSNFSFPKNYSSHTNNKTPGRKRVQKRQKRKRKEKPTFILMC